MSLLHRLKNRTAETLDEINPLIVWYFHMARKRFAGLTFLALPSIISLVVWAFYEQPHPPNVQKAMELFWWIYSGFFSLFFVICCSPDSFVMNDELMTRLKALSPLEDFHGSLVQPFLPIFFFWTVNVAAIFLLLPFFLPAGKWLFAVTLPPLFLAAFAFAFTTVNACFFKGLLDFSVSFLAGWPIFLMLFINMCQLVVCFFTDRGYYVYMSSLLILLPFYCVVYYRLGRHQLTYNYRRPYRGALLQLLVSGGLITMNGVWLFILNYWIAP